jgi:hypothetical protein
MTTIFDPVGYKQEFKTKLTNRIIPDTNAKCESVLDELKAEVEDDVVRTISLAETKDHAIPYTYHINEKGDINLVMPVGLHKSAQAKMKAETHHQGRKYKVMRRLQGRMREKGLEVKALPPISFCG